MVQLRMMARGLSGHQTLCQLGVPVAALITARDASEERYLGGPSRCRQDCTAGADAWRRRTRWKLAPEAGLADKGYQADVLACVEDLTRLPNTRRGRTASLAGQVSPHSAHSPFLRSLTCFLLRWQSSIIAAADACAPQRYGAARRTGPAIESPGKMRITIMIDDDVIEGYRASGLLIAEPCKLIHLRR